MAVDRDRGVRIRRTHGAGWIWWVLGAILLGLIIWAIAEAVTEDVVAEPEAAAPGVAARTQGVDVPVTLGEILDRPGEFYGRAVRVDGQVLNIISPTAITIRPLSAAGRELLIAGDARVIPVLTRGETVRVSGTVREFDLAGLERELGVDWNDELFAGWGGRPVILAQSVDDVHP